MNIFYQAAGGDLFSIGNNLGTKLGHLAGVFLVLVVGVVAAGCVARHEAGKAVAVVLIALIPAWFLLDSQSAISTLKATIHAL